MTPLFLFFSCLFLTFILTPYLINFYKLKGIVDVPGGRKIHKKVIPKMGGVFFSFIGLVILSVFAFDHPNFFYLISAYLVIVLCGIFDDIFDIRCLTKFAIQNVSSLLLLIYFAPFVETIQIFGIFIPQNFQFLILHLFIVGALNAINLLDGLDGLVSGFSLLLFSVVLVVSVLTGNFFITVLSASLMGALLGFLRYNSFPASIFLGDTGSLSLGFLLILCTLNTGLSFITFELDLTIPILLLALPIIDCVKVFIQRIINKQNPFSADLKHIHFQLLRMGLSHKFSVFFLELVAVVYILITLIYLRGMHFWAINYFSAVSLFIISLKPLVNFLNGFKVIVQSVISITQIESIKHKNVKLNFIFLLGAIFAVKIFYSLPSESLINYEVLFGLTLITGIFLTVTLAQQKMFKKIFEPNVFLNLTFFFLISSFGSGYSTNFQKLSIISGVQSFLVYGLAIPSGIILFNSRTSDSDGEWLTGIDLSLTTFVLLVVITDLLFNHFIISIVSNCLLEAFIFYFIYKVIIRTFRKAEKILTAVSFALPPLAISLLFILN
jgi:UDP-GlcNAc:undecaprenyl-phosphate GlcNAc-1-phosphate transferase